MQIGFVGLGKMGGNMVRRLRRDGGHEVVGLDHDPSVARALAAETGATTATSLAELVGALRAPRAVWVMVPAGEPTASTVRDLGALLEAGDVVVDGGNSRWSQDAENARQLAERGVGYLDVGVSGGVWGLEVGYCMMAGGETADVEQLRPVLDTLAPETAPDARHVLGERGWAHVGPVGAGHFTKMVHNGIEYGVMQALAEGYALLHESEYTPDLATVAHLWEQGSVVRSWLNSLAARAFDAEGSALAGLVPEVADSGEGRWTVEAAIDLAVPTPTISAALFSRFASRGGDDYAAKMLSALRNQFGGHDLARSRSGGAPGA